VNREFVQAGVQNAAHESTGMNTATSEIVIEMIVKPISREPFKARLHHRFTLLDMADDVSSITIASSTTKRRTASVRAARDYRP